MWVQCVRVRVRVQCDDSPSSTLLTHICTLLLRRTSVVFCYSQSQCQQREGRGKAHPEQDGQPVDECQVPHVGVYIHIHM